MWKGGVRVIVLDDENRILMVKQCHEEKEIWMLPGGGIEEGETSEAAVVREVKEETGLDVEAGNLLWHIEEVSPEKGQRFVNFFFANIIGGKLHLGTDPERSQEEQVLAEVRFMTKEEVASIKTLYPENLRQELWQYIEEGFDKINPYKIRNK